MSQQVKHTRLLVECVRLRLLPLAAVAAATAWLMALLGLMMFEARWPLAELWLDAKLSRWALEAVLWRVCAAWLMEVLAEETEGKAISDQGDTRRQGMPVQCQPQ